ncbi:serine/threonine-protein kinase [Kitasatospora sp. YST-16]|uniref:serine/threonine-protein kinase n=1 Tax=Kitasatospora sp. YST-16 TaxID=2998080 RepID=UPI002284DAE1|nr:serine/threonine-protein kinase [Kitasatospora sp. YST-16]WAL75570.1 serine/threonine-protein kinase [Kitasatospora sp. YST-16]WNW41636.1 serine/threonine-protein kinase [Streptomyces sp. Li-HN-5-13]
MTGSFEDPTDIESHYEILDQVSFDTGQGDLYAGRDRKTGEKVAIKAQKERQFESTQCFAVMGLDLTDEGTHTSALSEVPGIPKLITQGVFRGRRCLVMEYVDGIPLYDVLSLFRPVRETATVASVIGQLCEVLDDVHQRGYVHRDVKPDNAMLEHSGRLRLLDLGLAMPAHQKTEYGCGTIGYAPPEQLGPNDNGVTPQADVFSLGCVLLEMTVMQLPYDGTRSGITAEDPVVLPRNRIDAVPKEFAEIALAMVELKPENRPASVREVYEELRAHIPPVGSPAPKKPLHPDPTEYYRSIPHRW